MEDVSLQNELDKLKIKLKKSIIEDFWNPFNYLKENLFTSTILFNELIALGGRYNALKQHFNSGIIYLKEYNIESNKIRKSLLELIDQIEIDLLKIDEKNNGKTDMSIPTNKVKRYSMEELISERKDFEKPHQKAIMFFQYFMLIELMIIVLFPVSSIMYEGITLGKMIAFILSIIIGVIIYEGFLKSLIKSEKINFNKETLIELEVKGDTQSIFDTLLRLNLKMKVNVDLVDFENFIIHGKYQREMDFENRFFFNLLKFGDGTLEYHYRIRNFSSVKLLEVRRS